MWQWPPGDEGDSTVGGVGSGRKRKDLDILIEKVKEASSPVEVAALAPAQPPEVDYDVRVIGPKPNSPGAYVLVLYDRPTPIGIRSTLYDVDYLDITKHYVSGYLKSSSSLGPSTLVIQFPSTIMYVLVHKSQLLVEPAKPEVERPVGFFVPSTVDKAGETPDPMGHPGTYL